MPSKFKNIAFHTKETSSEFGRRIIRHEFPFQDQPFNEDLGRKTRVYNVSAYVIGRNWEEDRDSLIRACEDSKAGTLEHPDFGAVKVYCEAISVTESKVASARRADFEFTFVEAGAGIAPAIKINTIASLFSKIERGMIEATSVFKKVYNIAQHPEFLIPSMVTTIMNSIDTIKVTVSPSIRKKSDDLMKVDVRDTDALGTALYELFTDDTDDLTLAKIFYAVELMPLDTTTPDRLAESTNQNILVEHLKNMSLLCAVRQTAATEFDSYEQAIKGSDKILILFEEQNYEDKAELTDVRTAFIQDINARAPDLSRLVKKKISIPRPALVVAYDVYEDANRADEIVKRNHIANPVYVGGSIDLELLSD